MKSSPEYETYALSNGEPTFQQVKITESGKEREERQSFFQKYIEKGSVTECVINLCIISFGIGLLALPQKVNYVTLIMIPILIIICGIINYWTFTVLGDASRKLNIYKYEDIISALFNPCFSYFFIFVMAVGLFGVMVLFQVILYKFLGGVINEIFSYGYTNMEIFASESFWGEKRVRLLVCYSITLFVLFPLCLIKTISQMRYASTFGVFSVFLVITIVVIQCPSFYIHNVIEGKQEINLFDFSNGFGPDLKFIQSISTIIYAYECHAGIFPVISSLSNPTRARVQKVFKNATSVNIIAYIIITLAGYLSQPENTPDLVLEREKISKNDYLMTIGLALFSITLATKISASYNCFRALILNILKYDPINYPNGINLLITVIILTSTTFVAAMFQNISDYISLNGSFYGLIIAVIMPGIIYIKTNTYSIFHIKNILAMIFILALCSVGALTIYFTLKKIFEF